MTTQKTTTTYVIKYSSYAPRGEQQGLTVVRSRCSSIGHCEGAAKAVRAVRAATALSPVASLSHLFQSSRLLFRVFGGFLVHRRPLYSSHPTVHLETSAPLSTARVTFSGFTGGLNTLIHALNGNIFLPGKSPSHIAYCGETPFICPRE